jgi:large subunit ribosomal protein L3
MAGHMGVEQKTVKNLRVMKVNSQENLLLVKGAIPGPTGAVVLIRKKVTD